MQKNNDVSSSSSLHLTCLTLMESRVAQSTLVHSIRHSAALQYVSVFLIQHSSTQETSLLTESSDSFSCTAESSYLRLLEVNLLSVYVISSRGT